MKDNIWFLSDPYPQDEAHLNYWLSPKYPIHIYLEFGNKEWKLGKPIHSMLVVVFFCLRLGALLKTKYFIKSSFQQCFYIFSSFFRHHHLLNPESKEEPEPPDPDCQEATHSFSTVLNINTTHQSSFLPICPPHGPVGGRN